MGELFDVDSFRFLSSQNLLEYDLIIIDSESLTAEISEKGLKRIEEKFRELTVFVKQKNVPIIFICSNDGEFKTFGSDAEWLTIFQMLNLEIKVNELGGRKIEINNNSIFSAFLKKYHAELEYMVGFEKHPGTSIGYAKSKNISIGFYTADFVFVPTFGDNYQILDNEYLNDLYQACKKVRNSEEQIILPKWTEDYFLPNEKSQKEELERLKIELEGLKGKITDVENKIADHFPLKQLWTGTGDALENIVREVFRELGFSILPSAQQRDDIIMEREGKIVVVEIKGQTKSAAEKHAAQLEKWVSTYYSNEGVKPKGLLVVNTYREVPLKERNQESFPHQMLSFSEPREHCLLTTVQLCSLLLHCRSHPNEKDSEIDKLLNCVGIFKEYDNWQNYILNDTRIKAKKTSKSKAISK